MDRIDTDFANRYFAALRAHLAGRATPRAWGAAFGRSAAGDAIALQHLLLGMNAHINVDLGAATATVCPGKALPGVRRDFRRINELLAELTDDVQDELDAVSPRLADLDALGGADDEHFAVFSMSVARDDAWLLATALARTPSLLRPTVERLSDEKAAFLGTAIAHPPSPAREAVAVVRAAEVSDVRRVIDVLAAG
jgi:hypothetical protein